MGPFLFLHFFFFNISLSFPFISVSFLLYLPGSNDGHAFDTDATLSYLKAVANITINLFIHSVFDQAK